MLEKKRLPIGINEFRELIEENYYYIDKTLFAEEIIRNRSKVTLITRPRRFGKTLNMTMLREFFSMDVDSKEIFSGLKIMETKYSAEINKYPVLFFSFKDAKGDKRTLIQLLKDNINREYARYKFLAENLDEEKHLKYSKIKQALLSSVDDDLFEINNCIAFLSELIARKYNISPILLIDEYDTPMISAYENNCYEELRSFFTNLFSSALKDNPYLNFAVLTGIQRVAKENIFSGLNNLVVCTVVDKKYKNKFGLTYQETAEFLQYYEMDLDDEVSNMYNGYNFAGEQIFNPWSIINYASEQELKPYWVNTSSNTLIRNLLKEIEFNFSNIFEELLMTKKIYVPLNLSTTFFELRTVANFWGLLVNAGYLTLAELEEEDESVEDADIFPLRIPNGEVKREFRALIANYVGIEPSLTGAMFSYLLRGDTKNFEITYQDILLKYPSFHDFRENAYHMLFLGMSFYLEKSYIIKSNIEAGHGRADIIYTAKRKGDPNLIIEFKHGKSEDGINELAIAALEQIKDKRYYAGLAGRTLLVGVAHYSKRVKVVVELITIPETISS